MIVVGAVATEEGRIAVHIIDDDVRVAVIIKVAERNSSTERWLSNRGSRQGGHILKLAVAQVAEKSPGFPVSNIQLGAIEFRIHMAISVENIEPAIVIRIKKPATPADPAPADARSGGKGIIRELPPSQISV